MGLRFGTSGVRGLVTEMTDLECYLYTLAFLRYLKARNSARSIAVSGDHRNSTPRIMNALAFAACQEGLLVDYCGVLPTPAVAHYGFEHNLPSIMVTGSHVPEDRNGIKFNMPWGEVLKSDETEISRLYLQIKEQEAVRRRQSASPFSEQGDLEPGSRTDPGPENPRARQDYTRRYLSLFPPECLRGLKVVLYQHSSVSRDLLREILVGVGAEVVCVGWSDTFVPVDTEAVRNAEQLSAWVRQSGSHALVSADGDGDRPLVVDETGRLVRGDVLGILVADTLGADSVSAPVSCNTALEESGRFRHVSRTRIGSPYVIESMDRAVRAGFGIVVGYEANGGFLTATDVTIPGLAGKLKALPTRDAALPILALLFRCVREGKSVSRLVSELPARFTHSGLLRPFPAEKGKVIVESILRDGRGLADELFGELCGPAKDLDFTDGARMTFTGGDIVHLRPSGNAPEFRCYTESSSEARAAKINAAALEIILRRF